MTGKLTQGSVLPHIELRLIDGQTLTLPAGRPPGYLVLMFYRGHWCTQCRRHLSQYQEHLEELRSLDVTVVAASVDSRELTRQLAESAGYTFPMAYGVTRDDVSAFDPWWGDDEHGQYIQPTEMLVLRDGTIHSSMYGSGSLGRMPVEGVLFAVRQREERRAAAAS
ncbi:MAG: redoxin domain-containing protein [Chloroflexota bacterium]